MRSQIYGSFGGDKAPLFWLHIKTALLTLLTLGLYRFWAKTRIRRMIWGSVDLGGDRFEYTGTGLEKFLGFLVAIVILAVYLGLVQLLLFFAGMNLFTEPRTQGQALAQIGAIYITLLAVAPLMLFAVYRARRYKLARTRWRGIRFGMAPGAWGYAFRAMGHYLLTVLTLGILLPRQTFWLTKYMADRSWYGDGNFQQGGKWTALYPGMKHLLIGLGIMIAGYGGLTFGLQALTLGSLVGTLGYLWLIAGFVAYRVYAFNYLTRQLTLDGEVAFDARASTRQVLGIVIVGVLALGLTAALLFGVLGGIMQGIVTGLAAAPGQVGLAAIGYGTIAFLGLFYVAILLLLGGLSLILITQPLIGHFVTVITLQNADHLDEIQQRSADKGADAEGFADALDIGGAI
ncbi:MAG: DUF898 family protein [Pseudomonadota bacterium]